MNENLIDKFWWCAANIGEKLQYKIDEYQLQTANTQNIPLSRG